MCRSLVCCGGWEAAVSTRFSVAKWLYCWLWTASAVAVWVLRDYGGHFLVDHVSSFEGCGQLADADAVVACAGEQVALRVSLGNLSWFGLHLLLTLWLTRPEDPRVDLHAGLWLWQLASWLGCLIGFMWLPEGALGGYAHFARYASGVFLVLQLVLLVNCAYEVNEWLVNRDSKPAWAVLISGAALGFCGGLVLTGICYHYYAPRGSCSLNIFFITWNLILGLALVGVLFVPGRAPTAGLFTSAGVWLYCSYLVYSALASEPPNSCVRGGGLSAGGWVGVVAFFIALAAVVYATLSAGVASGDMFGGGEGKGEEAGELPYRPDFFHLMFLLASCYIAMLFTNWATDSSSGQFDRSWASTWVKMASSWACALLYGWTVLAPAVLRHRDFGPTLV